MKDNSFDELGEDHVASSANTPLRDDAFDISDKEKITKIEEHITYLLIFSLINQL